MNGPEKAIKPLWQNNAETMIGAYSILAALAGVLLTAVVLDASFARWKIPVTLLSLSIGLFILGIEKFGDALDENDVDKFLTWLIAYNVGVVALFFGLASFIINHYRIGYRSYGVILVITLGFSLKWLKDIWELFFWSKAEYQSYRDELLGNHVPKKESDCLMRFHRSARKLLEKTVDQKPPHENVYARLGPSKIHGIGIFAIRDIPKGTNLFAGDASDMVWLDKAEIDATQMSKGARKLYDDFCVLKDGKYGCPSNFNNLTVGWYLNEPQKGIEPNVWCDENYDFFAAQDIREGEELTVVYATYSQ